MKKILTNAVAIGNATARSTIWHPRTDGTMKGSEISPGKSFFVALRMYSPLEP